MKNIYTCENHATPMPDLTVQKVSGDRSTLEVWFSWNGQDQWLRMSTDNHYGDGYWLVVEERFTPDFEEHYTEGDGQGYDSFESVFEVLHPANYPFEITA